MNRRDFLLGTTGLTMLAGCAAPSGGGTPTLSLSLPVSQIASVFTELTNGFSGALGKVSSLLPADSVSKVEGFLSSLADDAKQVVAAASDPQVQSVVKTGIAAVEGVVGIFGGAATGGVLTAVIAAAPTLISLVEDLAGMVGASRLAARATMSVAEAHLVMQKAAAGQL